MRKCPIITTLIVAISLFCVYCLLPASKMPTSFWDKGKGATPTFGIEKTYGQGSQTIYATVFTDAQTLGASTPITNIGQSNHVLTMQATDVTATSCQIPTWYISLEGSFDGTTYKTISAITTVTVRTTPTTLVTGQTYAYGAFPFIRVNYVAGGTNLCHLSVFYTGTIPSTSTPTFITGVSGNYLTQQNLLFPGPANITGLNGTTGQRLVLYGLILSNLTAANAATVSILESVTSRGAYIISLPPSATTTLQFTGMPWFTSNSVGTRLSATVAESSTQVESMTVYRLE